MSFITTNGPRRGFVAKWLMRLEAAGSILRMTFLGVTAASTLTSALALIGLQWAAPYVLVAGLLGTVVFAYVYVEWGVFNRKNRERVDRGNNFSRPDMRIDDEITGCSVFAAVHGREPNEEEHQAIANATETAFQKHRNGVEVPE